MSRPALRPRKPATQWLLGLSLGAKGLGHEANHSPPSNTEVKNAWNYTSTPHMPSWCPA